MKSDNNVGLHTVSLPGAKKMHHSAAHFRHKVAAHYAVSVQSPNFPIKFITFLSESFCNNRPYKCTHPFKCIGTIKM